VTEAEWADCADPGRMLLAVGARTERQSRMLVAACARRVLPADPDIDMLAALDAAERYADGLASKTELGRLRRALNRTHPDRFARWFPLYVLPVRSVPAWHAAREGVGVGRAALGGLECAAWGTTRRQTRGLGTAMEYPGREFAAQADLIRDVFGDPFRPVAFDPGWRTEAVVGLARGMYESRDFSPMPVLADALDDAGCAADAVLAHCRGEGPHVRGCWVVDAVLGKT
jgi:hypothetical protein